MTALKTYTAEGRLKTNVLNTEVTVAGAIVWTSPDTVTVEEGSRIYIPQAITLVEVRLYATAAPTVNVEADLLVNGSSVITAGTLDLAAAENLGSAATITSPNVNENDYMQVEILDAGTIAGPVSCRVKFTYV